MRKERREPSILDKSRDWLRSHRDSPKGEAAQCEFRDENGNRCRTLVAAFDGVRRDGTVYCGEPHGR